MLSRSPSRGERDMSHSSGHCKQGMPNFGRSLLWEQRTFFSLSNEKAIYNIMHNDKGQISICSQV